MMSRLEDAVRRARRAAEGLAGSGTQVVRADDELDLRSCEIVPGHDMFDAKRHHVWTGTMYPSGASTKSKSAVLLRRV